MSDRPTPVPPSREVQEEGFWRSGGAFRWCIPRITICHAADRPPWWMWNRYPHNVIGAAFRLPRHRYLSVVWKRSGRRGRR